MPAEVPPRHDSDGMSSPSRVAQGAPPAAASSRSTVEALRSLELALDRARAAMDALLPDRGGRPRARRREHSEAR